MYVLSMYVYMYVCMYVYMYVCMHVCMYVRIYVCTYIYIYIYIYICTYVCMHVCIYVCMYVCMYVLYIYVYIRIYINVCMYVRAYVYMYVSPPSHQCPLCKTMVSIHSAPIGLHYCSTSFLVRKAQVIEISSLHWPIGFFKRITCNDSAFLQASLVLLQFISGFL